MDITEVMSVIPEKQNQDPRVECASLPFHFVAAHTLASLRGVSECTEMFGDF